MPDPSPTRATSQARARREKAAALRAEQQRRDRRALVWLISATGVVVALIVAAVVWGAADIQRQTRIDALVETEPGAPVHDPRPLDATALPPTGGTHSPQWQDCGVYGAAVRTEYAVHSLEHGAVWVAYQPGLDAAAVEQLAALADGEDYVLISPYPELASPVVATAWGKQLRVTDPADPRLSRFVARFAEGPQTPEPGAPCDGGVADPA